MEKEFKAIINYNVKSEHPDIEYIKNVNEKLSFQDTYTLDINRFEDQKHMINYMKNDLSLVASGGYSKEFIYNVSFDIKRIK